MASHKNVVRVIRWRDQWHRLVFREDVCKIDPKQSPRMASFYSAGGRWWYVALLAYKKTTFESAFILTQKPNLHKQRSNAAFAFVRAIHIYEAKNCNCVICKEKI